MTDERTHVMWLDAQIFTAALQKSVQENDAFRQQVEQVYAKQAKTCVGSLLRCDGPRRC